MYVCVWERVNSSPDWCWTYSTPTPGLWKGTYLCTCICVEVKGWCWASSSITFYLFTDVSWWAWSSLTLASWSQGFHVSTSSVQGLQAAATPPYPLIVIGIRYHTQLHQRFFAILFGFLFNLRIKIGRRCFSKKKKKTYFSFCLAALDLNRRLCVT